MRMSLPKKASSFKLPRPLKRCLKEDAAAAGHTNVSAILRAILERHYLVRLDQDHDAHHRRRQL